VAEFVPERPVELAGREAEVMADIDHDGTDGVAADLSGDFRFGGEVGEEWGPWAGPVRAAAGLFHAEIAKTRRVREMVRGRAAGTCVRPWVSRRVGREAHQPCLCGTLRVLAISA